MPKWNSSHMADAAFSILTSGGSKITSISVCAGQPGNFTAASVTGTATDVGCVLAHTSFDTSAITAVSDTGTGGRQLIFDAISCIQADATGTADHIALVSTAAGVTRLYYITTCSTQAITSTSNKVNLSTFAIVIAGVT